MGTRHWDFIEARTSPLLTVVPFSFLSLPLILIILCGLSILWSTIWRRLLELRWILILKWRLLILCRGDVKESITWHGSHRFLVLEMNVVHYNTSFSLFLSGKVALRFLRACLITSRIWNPSCFQFILYTSTDCDQIKEVRLHASNYLFKIRTLEHAHGNVYEFGVR